MSAIKDCRYTIELSGKKYKLLFSLNVLDEIQTKFGGYDKLSEVFNQNNVDWIKNTKWILTMLINEGLLEDDENATLFTEQQIGRLIHIGNLKEVQQAIYASFSVGIIGDDSIDNTKNNEESGEMKAVQGS